LKMLLAPQSVGEVFVFLGDGRHGAELAPHNYVHLGPANTEGSWHFLWV
jgi:hypothetical protein